MFIVCSQKQETFTGYSKLNRDLSVIQNERQIQKRNQLSELFNERKTLCAELECASGLAELQINFNMMKCESEKRGK